MSKNKEVVQEKYFELQTLNQQLQQLSEQFQALGNQANELNIISSALESLDKAKGDEMFVSLGSGVFAKASLKDKEKVLLNVGSGVMVEKKVNKAKELIKTQLKEIKMNLGQMENNMKNWSERIEDLQRELQSLVKEQ